MLSASWEMDQRADPTSYIQSCTSQQSPEVSSADILTAEALLCMGCGASRGLMGPTGAGAA